MTRPVPNRHATMLALSLAATSPLAFAFSSGSGSCTDVLPPHAAAGPGTGGLALLAPASYQAGQTLTVTLSTSNVVSFKGLLLWVEDGAGQRVGALQVPPGYALATALGCPGSQSATLMHSNPDNKPIPVSFSWTAPAVDAGPVTVRALVATSIAQAFFATPATIAGDRVFGDSFENPPVAQATPAQ